MVVSRSTENWGGGAQGLQGCRAAQWGGTCRGKGARPSLRVSSSTGNRSSRKSMDASTRGPAVDCGVYAERGAEEQIAPDLENKEAVAFCFLADSSEILQLNQKL